ncbi:MAG: hypothetical protein FJW36_03490 [Acidobacteria bacterium]|nr:hypothetical protein [Acidobacteriota bacterium]
MNSKIVVGLLAGAALGFVDGLTAWFKAAVRPFIMGILIGSTFKGVVVGIICALLARKVRSVPVGIGVGAAFGLLFAYLVASMPAETGEHYYVEIMVPGFVVGAIIGFLTQKYGASKEVAHA